jgi:methylmalonyl-CoA mutase cobalamin-binding domain/chain
MSEKPVQDQMTSQINEALLSFDEEKLSAVLKGFLSKGVSPIDVLNQTAGALREVGEKYEKGELYLVHLVAAGDTAKNAIKGVLEPAMKKADTKKKAVAKIVIGTVAGDIHDIGKDMVATMLFANGFEVYDLGKDIAAEEFARTAKQVGADIVAASAMLTMSMPEQREIIKALKKAGIRNKVKVMVGGATVSKDWVKEIGADGTADDAVQAVKVAKELLGIKGE